MQLVAKLTLKNRVVKLIKTTLGLKSPEYKMKKRNILRGINYRNRDLFEKIKNNVVFIHIPKSAGMSLVKALYGKNGSNHANALDFQYVNPEKFNSCFKFAVSRNPYYRLYSAYNYLSKGGKEEMDVVWRDLYLKKYSNFEDFVINGLETAIEKRAEHFIPQYLFVTDENLQIICDYIGKFEELDKVIERLSKEGIVLSLEKLNSSTVESLDNKSLYTDEMIAKVNHLYKEDFDYFDYQRLT
jgi:hypothetical protein